MFAALTPSHSRSVDRNSLHCESACGCEWMRRSDSIGTSATPSRQWRTSTISSPTSGEVESQQQVVRLVDRAGRRVFDRQHRAIDVPLDHRLEHLLESAVGLEAYGPLRDGKVLQRGLVAIGAFGSLEGHRDLLRRIRGAGLQRILLPPHRVIEDLAEDATHEGRVEAQAFAIRRPMLQERRFAIGIADGAVAVGLHSRDLPRQPGPLAERGHQHRIDVVKALP